VTGSFDLVGQETQQIYGDVSVLTAKQRNSGPLRQDKRTTKTVAAIVAALLIEPLFTDSATSSEFGTSMLQLQSRLLRGISTTAALR